MKNIDEESASEIKLQSINLSYTLSYEEAYEAFFLLSSKFSKKIKQAVSFILLAVAAILVVFYALNPYNLEYFVLPFLSLGVFLYVQYYPQYKAKNGAKKVKLAKGTYKIIFFTDGRIKPFNGEEISVSVDKDSRAFETETLFVIRPDRSNTFCFPKRVIKEKEINLVRETLYKYMKKFEMR